MKHIYKYNNNNKKKKEFFVTLTTLFKLGIYCVSL